MDWKALGLSLQLGLVTVALLLPLAFLLARWLAFARFRGRGFVEADTPEKAAELLAWLRGFVTAG